LKFKIPDSELCKFRLRPATFRFGAKDLLPPGMPAILL